MDAKDRYQSIVGVATKAANDNSKRQNQQGTLSPNATLDISRVDFLCGDALAELRRLPDSSVHTCVTSPPYWGSMRDYGHKDQIGLEGDAEDYIQKLVEVLRELAWVLDDGGSVWIVLGDTYSSSGGTRSPQNHDLNRNVLQGGYQKPTVPRHFKRPRDPIVVRKTCC
jgi:DNA methylase